MDKNFVSIDDLVRQRLGGGEEPERAGAWLQMRDLLDEEMPQSRVGFIFWRRLFSAIAVLVLLSAAGIGGYMYTMSGTATLSSNNGDNSTAAASNTNEDLTMNMSSTTSSTTEIKSSEQISNMVASSHVSIITSNKPNTEKGANALKQVNRQILASQGTTSNRRHNNKKSKAASNPKFLTELITANELSKQPANKAASPIIGNTNDEKYLASVAKHSHISRIEAGAARRNGAGVMGSSTGVGNNAAQPIKAATSGKIVSSDSKPVAAHPLKMKVSNELNQKVAVKHGSLSASRLALGGGVTSTGKHLNVAASNSLQGKLINPTVKPVTKNVFSSGGVSLAANKAVAANKNLPTLKRDAEEAEISKQPKLRLQLAEHLITIPGGESYYKLDTISIETISQQLAMNDMHGQNPGSKERNKAGVGSGGTPGISLGGSNTVATANTAVATVSGSSNGSQSAGTPGIVPAASASVSGQAGMSIKESQATKMNGNASTAEKLSATFNDIKFHVASAQFAGGLTAGINGTFFGPASFKGFQFGVTGNFIFGDNFSVLTELKYFERINNDYTLNDNYYSYTPAGGGQYSKVLNPLSYSFSTLHSIELPVSIRYCKSHFNFYVGGNIVYTFAINTGASTLSSVSTQPTLVSAAGNNTEPIIKASDFDSRFGLGYLFGISYSISPNVSLDIRNVQTLWDNASSPGAKAISSQLYKSPSLQLSVGYRFGGNKDKSKN